MMGATETAWKSTKALKTQENSVRRVERFKRRRKFAGEKSREKAQDVDVIHKTSPAEIPGGLDDFYAYGTLEEDTAISCADTNNAGIYEISSRSSYTYRELERYRGMDSSMKWRQCCTSILPKCQSVAHLLHHSKHVVSQLLDLLYNPPPSGPSLTLRIIGVLSRDLQGEIHPFFGHLMESFVSLLQKDEQPFVLSPELAGSVFRCMGHVFKFDARLIRSDLNVLKGYYARLLGHKKPYIRRYASEVFALLLRGADSKPLQKHLRFILRRVGRINANMDAQVKEKEGLIDGVVNLFFFLAKGVKGRMHSKGPAVLRLTLRFIERPEVSNDTEREANVLVAKGMIRQLCFHLRSP
eukprot:251868_1